MDKAKFQQLFDGKPLESRSISRDYILVTSPGHVSWQLEAAQKNPVLELFHQDVISIPIVPNDVARNRRWNQAQFFKPFYLLGITQSIVDELFQKHFGLSIPHSGETSANHWVPHVILFNVEVAENVWENRLAMFFDGNVENSLHCMESRIDTYGSHIRVKTLGERYLELWRRKSFETKRVQQSTKSMHIKQNERDVVAENAVLTVQDPTRGRKRRSILRQRYNLVSSVRISRIHD